jgi:hypothetical protein
MGSASQIHYALLLSGAAEVIVIGRAVMASARRLIVRDALGAVEADATLPCAAVLMSIIAIATLIVIIACGAVHASAKAAEAAHAVQKQPHVCRAKKRLIAIQI